ncbi:MAG: 1-acyl-sn-glycerol-3-phosphate acyltransferase [Actinomycetota bacterium]|nr:1-acyl-sn-glycerol-3-phosphate acyltransferase [Actinomycetota bacterium]
MRTRKLGWAFAFCVAVLRPLLMVLTRHDWRGTDRLPSTGGCVLVANHISHVDPMTYAHFVYDSGRLPRFLAKSEVMGVPVIGAILRSAGQIPVYRQSRSASEAFRAAVAAVRQGECVVVYPEGTITRDPDLWPMVGKTGAARIALSSDVPVIPTAQWGAQQILSPYGRRPHLLPRKTIQVRVGEPVDLADLRAQKLSPKVLREATDRIMAAITALLEEVRGEQAPVLRFDPASQQLPSIGNPRRAAPGGGPPVRRRFGRRAR